MFNFIFILSLFTMSSSSKLYDTDICNYNNKDSCLDTFLCSWCNVSTQINKTINKTSVYKGKCLYSNICSINFNESAMCEYNRNNLYRCKFYEALLYCLILFILVSSTYSIIYSITNNLTIESQRKSYGFSIIIILLVNIPGWILFSINYQYFALYLFFLIVISFLACLTGSTKKYVKYRKSNKSDYTMINNNDNLQQKN